MSERRSGREWNEGGGREEEGGGGNGGREREIQDKEGGEMKVRLRCTRLPREKLDWLCCCVSQDFCGRPLPAGSHSESRLRPDRRRVEYCKFSASKEVP